MPTHLPAGLATRVHRALDPLHALVYFAPEAEQELTATGLRPGRMCYFASRAAAMGPVGAGVVAATFYNFNPELVARHVPRAWTLATIDDVLAARLRSVDRAYHRLLGPDVLASPEVAEAAELTREATAGLPGAGRPLYAAHADLPWPAEPHLALWHAITLLREFRGDGHIAVLLSHGVSGLDALITHTATGRGFVEPAARATRGWSDEAWAAAVAELRARGLLDEHGALSATGQELRDNVEAGTDELAAAPWQRLGVDATQRLTELGRGLSRQAAAGGAFPEEVFGRR